MLFIKIFFRFYIEDTSALYICFQETEACKEKIQAE
jgi:hypothetical protein